MTEANQKRLNIYLRWGVGVLALALAGVIYGWQAAEARISALNSELETKVAHLQGYTAVNEQLSTELKSRQAQIDVLVLKLESLGVQRSKLNADLQKSRDAVTASQKTATPIAPETESTIPETPPVSAGERVSSRPPSDPLEDRVDELESQLEEIDAEVQNLCDLVDDLVDEVSLFRRGYDWEDVVRKVEYATSDVEDAAFQLKLTMP